MKISRRAIGRGVGRMLLIAGLLFGMHLQGYTLVVAGTDDTSEMTSLRGAVIWANRMGGDNTIELGQPIPGFIQRLQLRPRQWIFRLTQSGTNAEDVLGGDLKVTGGKLTIIGMSTNVIIDATGLGDRVFEVASNASLTLENLTITGGTAPAGIEYRQNRYPFFVDTDGGSGGAIANAGTLVMKNCVVVGNASGSGYALSEGFTTANGGGGGIYNLGNLSMDGCTLEDNAAADGLGVSGGNGGGLANAGYCVLTGCKIYENQTGSGGAAGEYAYSCSGGNGGGIFNSAIMVLTNCIIATNFTGDGGLGGFPEWASYGASPEDGGMGGDGAGVYNVGQMRLCFCTIHANLTGSGGNSASGGNGAIYNIGNLTVNTCTIGENMCGAGGDGETSGYGTSGGGGGSGGGVYNAGLLDLTSCTIVSNTAAMGGNGANGFFGGGDETNDANGGEGGSGGGIFNAAASTNLVVRNTLIAFNESGSGGLNGAGAADPTLTGLGPDLAGDFMSRGFNLVGMADGSGGLTNEINADQVGEIVAPINPQIGPLQMNGGLTPTHALLPGSPAINQGYSFGMHTDQRGDRRPYPYPGIPAVPGGDGSDIGACELQ